MNHVSRLLLTHHIQHRIITTECSDQLTDLASSASESGYAGVVALGGDGTASFTAAGLMKSGNPPLIAVFPAGNGNDWARTLKTESIEKSVEGIALGRTAILDAGLCSVGSDDSPWAASVFINSAGIGLDAHVLAKTIRIRQKLSIGKLGYLSALVSTLIEMPLWEGTLTLDGDNIFSGKYLSITVGVCPFVGGGMMLSPSSVPDDGKLDTTVVRPISRTYLVRSLPMIYRGRLLDNPSVSSWSGNEFRLKANGRIILELDGEEIREVPDNAVVTLKSLPSSIRAVVGPEY